MNKKVKYNYLKWIIAIWKENKISLKIFVIRDFDFVSLLKINRK